MKVSIKLPSVFISFAEPDRPLIQVLCNILQSIGIKPYYTPDAIRHSSPEQWRAKVINEGIKNCNSFVSICTRESLKRSWVLFEAGAAAAFGVKCYCTRIEGITESQIHESIPYAFDLYHFKLYDSKDLHSFLMHIYIDCFHVTPEKACEKIDSLSIDRPNLLDHLIALAKTRWVFIAGNTVRGGNKRLVDRNKEISQFVRRLTKVLLQEGFSITACFQVKAVGKVALEVAEEFVTGRRKSSDAQKTNVDYEIGGIYPVDRYLRRQRGAKPSIESKWQDHLMKFRKSYLEKQEWLILIGGNEGTLEEHDAAMMLNQERILKIRIYSVPCFGGTAYRIFRRMTPEDKSDVQPCVECRQRKGKCRKIDEIVHHLSSPVG